MRGGSFLKEVSPAPPFRNFSRVVRTMLADMLLPPASGLEKRTRLNGVTRRFVLRAGLFGACACLAPWPGFAASTSYYVANKAQFLNDFQGVCAGAEKWLAPRTSDKTAKVITSDAKHRFETLLPDIPDIGGTANRNQPFLTMAAWLTALTQAMAEKGLPPKDAGRLLYDLYASEWAALPKDRARVMGASLFAPAQIAALKDWAANSQKRANPADWVGRFVPGDGKTFDVGYDYSECGAVKYFKAHGVAAVAPYFCLNDFLASKAQGTGLVRSGTIAQGAPICDFRYKRDRTVTQDWETEVPRFAGKQPA